MSVITTIAESSDAELIVKRLFKVAEILSREPLLMQDEDSCRENDCKNRDTCNIGYCEPREQFSGAQRR